MQGFDEFFKDVDDWVRNDRLVIGVQLRLVGRPEVGRRDQALSQNRLMLHTSCFSPSVPGPRLTGFCCILAAPLSGCAHLHVVHRLWTMHNSADRSKNKH